MNKTIIHFGLLGIILIGLYYVMHWNICNERFQYCYLESIKPNGECGVYYVDKWVYTPTDALTDFINSWYKCEGVLD